MMMMMTRGQQQLLLLLLQVPIESSCDCASSQCQALLHLNHLLHHSSSSSPRGGWALSLGVAYAQQLQALRQRQ